MLTQNQKIQRIGVLQFLYLITRLLTKYNSYAYNKTDSTSRIWSTDTCPLLRSSQWNDWSFFSKRLLSSLPYNQLARGRGIFCGGGGINHNFDFCNWSLLCRVDQAYLKLWIFGFEGESCPVNKGCPLNRFCKIVVGIAPALNMNLSKRNKLYVV